MTNIKDTQITTRIHLKGLEQALDMISALEPMEGIGGIETIAWTSELKEMRDNCHNPVMVDIYDKVIAEIFTHTKKEVDKKPRKRYNKRKEVKTND